jgi:hypothetical protein
MLLLKRHLVDLVRRGKKRQTIRLWSRPLLRPGQVSYTPGLGRMKITAVDVLPTLRALTEADARADGFSSLSQLRREIARIYGSEIRGRTIFRIRFEWPIDAEGEKLVVNETAPAAGKSHAALPRIPRKKTRASSLPTTPESARTSIQTADTGLSAPSSGRAARSRKMRSMTAHQRHTLRRSILKNAPGG